MRRAVLANLLWEDVAYMDGLKVAEEIKRLIPLCPAIDVYNIALEERLIQKLRHTPLFIAVEMCKYPEHKLFVADLLPKIITRADMLTDFLALYWKDGKKPICNQAKKGLRAAFHNFNEYKLAKYDRNAAIKLRDVMFLCRPKPNNDYETKLFKKVADRTLTPPETWEVLLSAVDRRVIVEGLTRLKSSMLLPLDFLKAERMNPEFSRDIEDAMLESYKNLPKLSG